MAKKTKSEKLTVAEAAAYCGVSKQYLYQCRTNKTGPKSYALHISGMGKGPSMRVFYFKDDLKKWNATRPVKAKKAKKQQSKKAA